ncbi:MAG: peptidase [Caulobacter sp.]|nr:peptidase [Caulobacter sp.]
MLRGIGLTVALVVAAVIGWMGVSSPHPKGADAASGEFSAMRAFEDDKVIAARPHPVGSAANQQVRDYLVRRMTALSLSPRVQAGSSFEEAPYHGALWVTGGQVENILGVLPGRDRSKPAIALMAHYDSVAGSPGAADDAAGVASALEIARALKAGPQPERDVVFVITDGEEAGLLGARAFYASNDPLVAHIGAVINMESRGGGGRANMFQTGPDNAAWVDLLKANARSPVSSSLAVFLYEHMPNDTDFTVSNGKGIPGLNFAFIGRQFDYHSPSSTPAVLDKGALQSMGEQALAVTRAAALSPTLPAKAPSAVYSTVFASWIVAYPVWGGWIVLGLAAALIGVAMARSRKAGQLIWPDVGLGVGVAVFLLLWTAALLELARRATGSGFGWLSSRRLLAAFGTYELAVIVLIIAAVLLTGVAAAKGRARIVMGVAALVTGAASSLFGGFDMIGLGLGAAAAVTALIFIDPIGRPGAWAGILLTGLVAAIAAQLFAPLTGFLIAWPLLAGAVAAAASQLAGDGKFNSCVVCVTVAAVALGWVGVYLHGVIQGIDQAPVLALFAWLGAIVAWPLFQSRDPENGGLAGPLIAMVVGVALIALLNLHDPWTARRPRATDVRYVADQSDNSFWRISLTPGLDPWTRSALTGDGGALVKRGFEPLTDRPVDAAKALAVPVTPPQVTLAPLPDGRMQLTAQPAPGSRVLSLSLKGSVGITGLTIDGKPAHGLEKAGVSVNVRWQGAAAPIVLVFKPAGPGQLAVGWAGVTEQWPAQARPLPTAPNNAMAWDLSGSTIVKGESRFSW